MLVHIVRFIFILIGAISGIQVGQVVKLPSLLTGYEFIALIVYVVIGVGLGYVVGGVIGRRLASGLSWVEANIVKLPTADILISVGGLILGLIIAALVSIPFWMVPYIGRYLAIFVFVVFGYLGLRLALRKKEDLKRPLRRLGMIGAGTHEASVFGGTGEKILDTSVIIDGRIVDISRTGFIEGSLVVPRFVLRELQAIADSEDTLKRNRGRRGLDVLNLIQREPKVEVHITETDFPEIVEVDGKLVRLAKDSGATIITNDYNLNKIAGLQGVKVLNINELANAIKPVLLPGEALSIQVIREGKEAGQGVGYLDDGTMVVVDGGKAYIGKQVKVFVTSALQTPAGRMIFAKLEE